MHRSLIKVAVQAAILTASILGMAVASLAAGFLETDLVANKRPLTDSNGIPHTPAFLDPNLLNPWGLTASSSSPFWVSDNGAGVATLYNTAGTPQALVVSIPAPGDPLGSLGKRGTPTGTVFNIDPAASDFQISGVTAGGVPTKARAVFLFATEDGTIVGWNPGVNPPGFDPTKAGTYGIIAVDNSNNPIVGEGAVYKGLAIATDAGGTTRLYATNFRAGTVEVYDTNFKPVLVLGAFTDPKLPRGYAPFDIVPVSGKLVVTYAVQDAAKHDDVAGMNSWNRRHLRSWRSVVSTTHSARPAQFALGRGRVAGQLRSIRRFIVDRKFRQRSDQRLQCDDRGVHRQNPRSPRTGDCHRRIVEPSCRQRRQWW